MEKTSLPKKHILYSLHNSTQLLDNRIYYNGIMIMTPRLLTSEIVKDIYLQFWYIEEYLGLEDELYTNVVSWTSEDKFCKFTIICSNCTITLW